MNPQMCASAPKRDPYRIWASIFFYRRQFGNWWNPDRRRLGRHYLGMLVFNFSKFSPFRVGSWFDAETQLLETWCLTMEQLRLVIALC
jgi:hypothetical protein